MDDMRTASAYITVKSGMFKEVSFSFDFGCMYEFKQELLKRFGNINGTSNGNRHKEKVKNLIRTAESFEDIRVIDDGMGWAFKIRVSL